MDEIEMMGLISLARRRRLSEGLRRFDITYPQLQLIRIARRRGALSPSEAATELFCDRPTATVIANNCVAKGWLLRRRSSKDRRSTRLALSGAGEELIDLIDAARVEGVGDALDLCSEEERAAFRTVLERIYGRAQSLYGEA